MKLEVELNVGVVQMLLSRIAVVAAVPLATALSYLPAAESSSGPEASRPSLSASGSTTQRGISQNEPLASESPAQREATTSIVEALERHGLPASEAGNIVAATLRAGGLDAQGFQWHQGERLTGLLLVPDSARTLCGYSGQPLWFFRTHMLNPERNIKCSARLHKSLAQSTLWASRLAASKTAL